MRFSTATYLPGSTPLHRADARVKIVVLVAYSVGIFFATNWWSLGAFAVAVVAACAVGRIPPGVMNRLLVPVYVFAAFSVLFNFIGSPTVQGLESGLFFGVRMVALVAASFVVCLTTTSSDLLDAFRSLISPLSHLRVPVDDVAFTLSLALRFIPVIERQFQVVRNAQRARGADLPRGFMASLGTWGAAFSAMFVGLFRHADALADAMDARCYGAGARTRLPKD